VPNPKQPPSASRPFSQREVQNHLLTRLRPGMHTWIDDPAGARDTIAYGSRHWPSQLIYVISKPSTLDLRLIFTPRRISLTLEPVLWEAAERCRLALRKEGVSSRRRTGNTEETERDIQYVIDIPAEGLTEQAFDTLDAFLIVVADCLGVGEPADDAGSREGTGS
jgi:hypothetical protein